MLKDKRAGRVWETWLEAQCSHAEMAGLALNLHLSARVLLPL